VNFNLEYVPFNLTAPGKWSAYTSEDKIKNLNGNVPVWIIRNGVNDAAQDANTDFAALGTKEFMSHQVSGSVTPPGYVPPNGNGSVRFVNGFDLSDPDNLPVEDPTALVIKGKFTDGMFNSTTSKIRVTLSGGYSGMAQVYYAIVNSGTGAPANLSDYTGYLGEFYSGNSASDITINLTNDTDDVWLIAFNDGKRSKPYRIVRFNPDKLPNIKDAFGITNINNSVADEEAAFEAVHDYLESITADELDDKWYEAYINLESLTVKGYPDDDWTYGNGKLENSTTNLTLIVVGINSFKANGTYEGGGEGSEDPHLVFQFKDIPVEHRLNTPAVNAKYPDTEASAYLVDNFLAGLKGAGVPFEEDWIWAPKRITFGKIVEDRLWLPTEWEMFDKQYWGPPAETASNQGRLGYYEENVDRQKKKGGESIAYWLGSADFATNGSHYCYVTSDGASKRIRVDTVYGFAPAFCIK
jgi:hypothetical protein